jgi:hypothetical protein
MTDTGGNKAVRMHETNRKALLLFQMMGHGRPCRYLGEFRLINSYKKDDVPDTAGVLRKAIVFRLLPVESEVSPFDVHELLVPDEPVVEVAFDTTVSLQLTSVRKKQSLFRRRLITVEKECRLTGIRDLRFLRASHIKPWAACEKGEERVDGNNGLLLCPQADLLFDQGWITFGEGGRLQRSAQLPSDVLGKMGLDLNEGRPCGRFKPGQQTYLEFHRNRIFNRKFLAAHQSIDAMIHDLLKASA